MHRPMIMLSVTSALALFAGAASAQSHEGSMKGMDKAAMARMSGAGPHDAMAKAEYMASMKTMDKAMMSATGTTTDAMFARKMMAHHQGAIDMAQIELKRGGDADAKRIAQKTIDENVKGKAELAAWLKVHGG